MRYKLMNLFSNIVYASGTGEDVDEIINGEGAVLQNFVDNLVTIALWAFTAIGVLFCINIGFKIAMAKTPEDKKAAKDKLIWFLIGTAIIFAASIIWSITKNFILGSLNPGN